MLIFLFGEDTFRSKQKLQEIIEQYKKVHKSGLNLIVIDCQSAGFEDLKQELATVSMFKEKKLIILKNAFSWPEFETTVLLKPGDSTIVFFEDGKADSRRSLFKFLEKNSKFQEFKPLASRQLLVFAKKEFARHGIKIQNEASEQLVIFCGSDLWRLTNEIKKLVAFKIKDKDSEINLKDVEQMVNSEIETDIFETIEAIAGKNKRQALGLLHKHLTDGDSVSYLLSMINYQFCNLLLVKTNATAGLHPFIVKKSYALCRRFTVSEIKKIFQKIFQVDLDIKTGKAGPETALDMLIAEI